jgi:hypothetical protein
MLKVFVTTLTVFLVATEAFQFPISSAHASPFRGSPVSAFSPPPSSCASTNPNPIGGRQRQRNNFVMSAQVSSRSWGDLKTSSCEQAVGSALNQEGELRKTGQGSAHVQSKLRLFESQEQPKITLYRDHAGWCPYCQVRTFASIESVMALKSRTSDA